MKLTPVFLAQVVNGQLVYTRPETVQMYLGSFEGKPVNVTIEGVRKNRTTDQNSWYWACVVSIPAEHYGYTKDEMHEAYKLMFLRKRREVDKPQTIKSSANLSTGEFTEYVEKCRNWAAEQGFIILDPNEIKI